MFQIVYVQMDEGKKKKKK